MPTRPRWSILPWGLVCSTWFLFAAPSLAEEPVSFRNEVMAVLSRAGCNQGACHGNLNGKNGFRLSLRGQDPDFDLASLTHDMLGRRSNRLDPENSLLLLKATATIPHEGGKRFPRESLEYAIFSRWLRQGLPSDLNSAPRLVRLRATPEEAFLMAPAKSVQLRVLAKFNDGSERDVTTLAVYEPSAPIVEISESGRAEKTQNGETAILVRYLDQRTLVRLAFLPDRPPVSLDRASEFNYIDTYLHRKFTLLRMRPSPLCPDYAFVRRAYLDTLGVLPTVAETEAFLNDTDPQKRSKLVDRLLQRPEFADFWALKWSDVLRNEEKALDRKGVQVFHEWIRSCIAQGKPLNEFARDLVAGRGSTYANPPANFYRAMRDPYTRSETMAQVFLGIRLQCARCHNHPFDRWTQDDYHNLAAFFSRVQYRIVENNRKDRLDSHEFDGDQIVFMAREGEVKHPRTGEPVQPQVLATVSNPPPIGDRLQFLADWVAAPENPFFARAQVNRIWMHLMGRGLVEPNDDFRASNPPSNPPLLDALSEDFVAHHFDLRHMVRTIMNSAAYQRSYIPNETNQDDEANFAHALVRPLQAEQLLDAMAQVTLSELSFSTAGPGTQATRMAGTARTYERRSRPSPAEVFLQRFGKPERLLACECERSTDATLNQAFQMLAGEAVQNLLRQPNNRLGKLLQARKPTSEMVTELYLAALCRKPSEVELHRAVESIDRTADKRLALEDFVWALLNSKEFLLRS